LSLLSGSGTLETPAEVEYTTPDGPGAAMGAGAIE
jgi:hypothetical protein